jgi:hypothetical protein
VVAWRTSRCGLYSIGHEFDKETRDMSIDPAPLKIGVVLALLTLFYGFGLGGAFGAAEDSIKGSLTASAAAVKDSVYSGDDAAMGKVTSKA